MLALEPSALLASSVGVSAYAAEKGPYSTVGEFDLDGFVTQDVVLDQFAFMPAGGLAVLRYSTISELKSHLVKATSTNTFSLWDILDYVNLVHASDPNDAEAFQILRQLHIAYPADESDPDNLAGKGRFPLVIILHGQHAWNVPNHRGYLYLQRELASWGIISVSLNTNIANLVDSLIEMRAESVLKTLDSLWTLAKSDSSSRLYERVDFTRIGLVGHSRGGDAVVKAAIVNSDPLARAASGVDRRYDIRAVCSLAPTDFTGTDASVPNSLNSTQAPSFVVLYGALDGDVSGADGPEGRGGTGFRLYDRADTEKSMVFFERCNHNGFNDVWIPDDTYFVHEHDVLSREDHRALAKEFIGGLFRWRLLRHSGRRRLFNGGARSATGKSYSLQWSFGQRHVLDDMENAAPNDGARQLLAGSSLQPMKAAAVNFPLPDPYTNHQTTVLVTAPNSGSSPLAAYALSFSSAQDWTTFSHLLLRVCADADVSVGFDPVATALADFDIIIIDGSANSARITAAALRVSERLRRPVPHLSKVQITNVPAYAEINCTVIHLETLAVDLLQIGGINLAAVSSFSIEIPPMTGQRQFFDSIELVKI